MDEDTARVWRREYMRKRRAAQREVRAPMTCGICGKPFEITQGNRRYCSDDCLKAATRERRKSEYLPPPSLCERCGSEIPYKSYKRKYCSDECADAVYRKRWDRCARKGITEERASVAACELCGKDDTRLVIDHDHACCPGNLTCGRCTRGMLCRRCNGALGMFYDDAEVLRRAAVYIEDHRLVRAMDSQPDTYPLTTEE